MRSIELTTKGKVALITLCREDKKNTFDLSMWNQFEEITTKLKEDLPHVIVITGSGNSFSAGFDVNPENPMVGSLIEAVTQKIREPVNNLVKKIRGAVDNFVTLEVPTIAAINGLAYGGGAELAVRCDMRVMDPSAVICFSEVTLGLMPDWGGCAALPKLVGTAKASEYILSAKKIDCDEALSAGLVNSISKPGQSVVEALELAEKIASNGPLSVRSALSVIRCAGELSDEEALNFESEKAVDLIISGECVHGITAFLSKEKPKFPGV